MSWTSFPWFMAAIGLVGAAGCAVGPDYAQPATRAPASWSAPLGSGLSSSAADPSSWWTAFHDAELDALIMRAVQSNLDLRVAEARLREARAIRGGSEADTWPSLDASGSYAKAKQSKNQPFFGALPLPADFPFEYNVYQAGFDAAWEIDLFGGKRRAVEAATAEWEGAIEARNAVLVSVLAEVARNYVELRGAQCRLAIARREVALQEEMLELTRARFRTGVAGEREVTRAAATLEGLRAALPPLQTAIRWSMHGLAVLSGRQPGEVVAELAASMPVPPVPPQVPIGLPSDVLRRRPDVRRSERQLAAETARVGVATSDWFPKFALTGDLGVESVSVGTLMAPGSLYWSIGPSFQWRALDFGRVEAEVQAQTAVQEAALASYEKAVLTALQETENAMVGFAQEQQRHTVLVDGLSENRRTLGMTSALYAKGRVNYFDVLDAQRTLDLCEDQLALSDQAVSLDLICLYKALGGGWETLSPEQAKALSSPASR